MKKYYGKVIAKKRGIGYLGEFITLYVDFGKDIRIFDNASWTLERFNIGDKVSWIYKWYDSRGTDNLKLLKRKKRKRKVKK